MTTTTKSLIVGAGMAGLSCADELSRAGHDFLLISDTIGGRVKYDPHVNTSYGAVFTMANYKQALRIVKKGKWINPLDVRFHNKDGLSFNTLSLHTLQVLPDGLRFIGVMASFIKQYSAFMADCLTSPYLQCLERHQGIKKWSQMSAEEFFTENNFEDFVQDLVVKFAYACTGSSMEDLTALDFLIVAQGLIFPINEVQLDNDGIAARYGRRLILDKVTSFEPAATPDKDATPGAATRRFLVHTEAHGTIACDNIILATPGNVTAQLLGVEDISTHAPLHVYRILATLKENYRSARLNAFDPSSPIVVTMRNHDGSYRVYTRHDDVDFGTICNDYSILHHEEWPEALFVGPRSPELLDQNPLPGVWTASDYTGLGMEPPSVSGRYVARDVLNTSF